ncbi:MAG: hypothetical protein EGQ34_00335 [Sutterella sp.]|nr:hypothetical protein [Sutterella sp.]
MTAHPGIRGELTQKLKTGRTVCAVPSRFFYYSFRSQASFEYWIVCINIIRFSIYTFPEKLYNSVMNFRKD